MPTKGILILAFGHPYYGRYAHNLAVSLKHADPDMPIALVYGGDALNHLSVFDISKVFDQQIPVPKEYVTREGVTEWLKAKTFLFNLSPFDETLYLDADTLWLPGHKPSELFSQFKDIDFTIANHGPTKSENIKDDYVWAKYSDIIQGFGLTGDELYYRCSSEFVYFKKNERTEKLFRAWQSNYDNINIDHKPFAGAIPDELPLSVAMMQTGVYPHQDMYRPIYWQNAERKIYNDIYQRFYALSAGGKVNGDWTHKHYNRLVSHYFNRAGLRHIWELQNKRRFLPERINF